VRLAAISDVHSNLGALEAVLSDIRRRRINRRVFVGDAVGYGPDPDLATALIKKECRAGSVAGNHDWAVLGLTDIGYFNPMAKAAIRWTDEALGPEARETLRGWPLVKVLKDEDILLVHATPAEPEEWGYLFSPEQAAPYFDSFRQRICLVGHSHMPFVAELLPTGEVAGYPDGTELKEGCRYIVNAGSVGQPRDRDPRASYALFEEGRVEIVRVPYDIAATQRKMFTLGLPAPLIERLSHGV